MGNANILLAFGLLVGLTLINYPISVDAQALLFTFGDSSYDVGNTQFYSSDFDPAAFWPYGMSVDRPSGRWSDGRIVPDVVAELIGIPNPVPAVLDPKADLSRGASFAISGATVLGNPANTMTLRQQVSKFVQIKGNWTQQQRAAALYMFNIGTDDYLSFAKTNPDATRLDQLTLVSKVLGATAKELMDLYRQGARKFAFQNLGPIGCLPIARQDSKTGEQCVEMLNYMAEQHNQRLKRTLTSLTVPFRGFRYSILDFHKAALQRIDNPAQFGYTDTNTSCCGIGSLNAFGCGRPNVHSNLCSYQRFFLYYDGRHNTERTNEAIGQLFFSGDKDAVSPVNLKELFSSSAANLLGKLANQALSFELM